MKIRIHDLHARMILGVYEWEKENARDIYLDITLEVPDERAMQSDKITDTLDYGKVTEAVVQAVTSSPAELIETLLARALEAIGTFPMVTVASVRILKPDCIPDAKGVSVEAERNYV